MPSAVITIQKTEQAQPGRKFASVQGSDNLFYKIPPGMLGLCQINSTYEVVYEDHPPQGQFKAWREIKSVKQAAVSDPPKQPVQTFRRTDAVDAERMFVCKILGDYITAGKVDLQGQSVVNTITMLRRAWLLTFGKQEGHPDDMGGDQVSY